MEKSLENYLLTHCSARPESLDWIEKQTNIKTNYPQMLSGHVQGQLLTMLVQISGSKKALEIGAFTGYSGACIALGLPEDGHLDSLEINDELEDLMRAGWEKAGVSDKITLHIGDAIKTLEELDENSYDFAFIDANKRQYLEYYEAVLKLVRKGGLILADDVLWDGKVYANPVPTDIQTKSLVQFNDFVAQDSRVSSVILPLRDGLTLIRKN